MFFSCASDWFCVFFFFFGFVRDFVATVVFWGYFAFSFCFWSGSCVFCVGLWVGLLLGVGGVLLLPDFVLALLFFSFVFCFLGLCGVWFRVVCFFFGVFCVFFVGLFAGVCFLSRGSSFLVWLLFLFFWVAFGLFLFGCFLGVCVVARRLALFPCFLFGCVGFLWTLFCFVVFPCLSVLVSCFFVCLFHVT